MIEQAIYGAQGAGGYRFLARSPGFVEAWLPEAERLCTAFGERPAGAACPSCVFAQPFGPRHVAVVQAADQGGDDAGRPGALGFRLMILPVALYDRLGGNPFDIADQFLPNWQAHGELAALEWTAAPPDRTVEAVQQVLNVPHSATLLGGVQALLDGRRLIFERSTPDTHLLRSLWALLPNGSRSRMWPASFAFGGWERFHAVVAPTAAAWNDSGAASARYINEEKAGDYPEGPYESRLQAAVEAGDAAELDDLFAGRGPRRHRMLRLALCLGALMFFNVPFVLMWLMSRPPAPVTAAPVVHNPSEAEKPTLPAADACPPMEDRERQQLSDRLHRFAAELGLDVAVATTDAALTDCIDKIDRTLEAPDTHRDPGRLSDLGPVQRQLRALLWKHGVADYDAPGMNTVEMVEKLQEMFGRK